MKEKMNRLKKFTYECQCYSDNIWRLIIGCGIGDEVLADEYQRFTELPRAIRYQQNVEKEVLE